MGVMTYATHQSQRDRISEAELRQMSDAAAQAIDETRLQIALDDAQAEIDGYLAGRYLLPLVDPAGLPLPVSGDLLRCAVDIVVYRLQTLRPADDIKDARRRYEDAIKLLAAFKDGSRELAGAALVPVLAGGVGGGSVEFNIPAEPPYSPFARSER